VKVRDIMTRQVETVGPGDSIRQAAAVMDRLNVGFLPVSDGTRVVGVVTDRDIVVRALAAGKDPEPTKVGEVMTEEVHYCLEEDQVEDIVKDMAALQVRRLPVLSREGNRLVGVVSIGDIAVHESEHITADLLRRISEPSAPDRPMLRPASS
jgi:CBS domain-containing protein